MTVADFREDRSESDQPVTYMAEGPDGGLVPVKAGGRLHTSPVPQEDSGSDSSDAEDHGGLH